MIRYESEHTEIHITKFYFQLEIIIESKTYTQSNALHSYKIINIESEYEQLNPAIVQQIPIR